MALPVERRGVPGCGPWGAGPTGGLPGLWPADGVLVGLSAVCAPRPCVAGVGGAGQVPAVWGDPRAAAVVFAAAARGHGRGHWCGAGAGGGGGGLAVPHTTVRDWWRRFGVRAPVLVAGLCALVVELGGLVDGLPGVAERAALAELGELDAWVRQRLGDSPAAWTR